MGEVLLSFLKDWELQRVEFYHFLLAELRHELADDRNGEAVAKQSIGGA